MLNPEQIQSNWDRHLKIIDAYIESPRKDSLKELFIQKQEFMMLAPASGKSHFHNAFPGGYIDHVNRVVKLALEVKDLWKRSGAIIDFTDEELVFSGLCHDLGKIGDGDIEGYIPQKDKWRQDKLNEKYVANTELPFMLIQDRSLFILQKYGIATSFNEYLAIRTHDGIYDDANKAYFVSFQPESRFRTNIVYILHQADFMAAKIEYDSWRSSSDYENKTTQSSSKQVPSSEKLLNLVKTL